MIESSESHCVYPEMLSHYLFTHNKLFIGDENKKEEKSMAGMSKEAALQKIEELKAYVEKCEEKEKEIPEMPRYGNYNVHVLLPDKPRNLHSSCNRSFENQETADLHSILSFELANLIYARAYLKVKDIQVDEDIDVVYRLLFSVHESKYRVVYYGCVDHFEDETPWFFTKREDADKVRDYMNMYVAHIKGQMF